MYSDDVSEETNSGDEEFGLERLFGLFAGNAPKSAEEATERLLTAVAEFAGDTSATETLPAWPCTGPRKLS